MHLDGRRFASGHALVWCKNGFWLLSGSEYAIGLLLEVEIGFLLGFLLNENEIGFSFPACCSSLLNENEIGFLFPACCSSLLIENEIGFSFPAQRLKLPIF